MVMRKSKVDIIWNVTRLCPWDCSICCVDAIHIRKDSKARKLVLRSEALTERLELPNEPKSNAFTHASDFLKRSGRELSLADKFGVIDNLAGFDVQLDISGGDPMVIPENWELLEYASAKIGKSNLTITATGLGVQSSNVKRLARLVGEFNFTFDPILEPRTSHDTDRPTGYAEANLHLASQIRSHGVFTRAELPLTQENCRPENLRRIYQRLHEKDIDRLLLMRLFPVGRGASQKAATPKRAEYLAAIKVLKNLETSYGKPNVRLQCALRHIDNDPRNGTTNPCDLLARSFGLMADGTLLLSPWAIGPRGNPLGEEWILGNLARTSLSDLLGKDRPQTLLSRLDENFGHCKIFAYLESQKKGSYDRIFDSTDPLFSNQNP